MEAHEALALLDAQHTFPGPFDFRVVVRPADKTSTLSAMTAAGGAGTLLLGVHERPSSKGTYVGLRVSMRVASAQTVLDVYAVLGQLPGVLANL